MTRGHISAEDAYVQAANPKSRNHSLLGIIEYEEDYLNTFGGVLNSRVERTDGEVSTIDPDATSQDKNPAWSVHPATGSPR